MSDNLGIAFIVVVVILLMAMLLFGLGQLSNANNVQFDCDNYGRTLVTDTWYKCEKLK